MDDLPPETQTGQNTFGCIVNKRIWVPKTPFLVQRLSASYYHGSFTISANLKYYGRHQSIHIHKDSIFGPGIYELTQDRIWNIPGMRFYDFITNNNCSYQTDDWNVGQLEMIRVDTVNRIFSGRFKFKIGAGVGCDTLFIGNGRFDVLAF